MALKLYILIRKDIPVADQGVQMAHVAAKFAHNHARNVNRIDWDEQPFVSVTVPNGNHLNLWWRKINQRALYFDSFFEPALNEELTAIACLHDGNLFDKLPLWNPEQK